MDEIVCDLYVLSGGGQELFRHPIVQPEEAWVVAETVTLAYVIDQLFRRIRRPDGREYANRDVAQWCEQWLGAHAGGGTFSPTYMGQLRSGKRANPTLSHLRALAAFFQVDPVLFVNEQGSMDLGSDRASSIRDQLNLAAALRDANVVGVALRAAALTPENIRKIEAEIAKLRDAQGKPDEEAPSS
jgi:transcriptional regulator with XRE-family HTH domain